MKRWYVVQVYAGYEEQIKADILKSIEEANAHDLFGEILVPSAKMKQFFETGDALKDEQLFPGYVLIQMENAPETVRLIMGRPRVLRFLGGKDPMPLTQREVERIQAQIRGEVTIAPKKHELEIGREVEIKDGPFASFVGIIESIDEGNEKLTVMVSIFGRMTPVELNFDQIKH